jgi:integrase
LGEARNRVNEAKQLIAAGKSPAKEKSRGKARVNAGETFGAWAERWLTDHKVADSTRDMRRSVYLRDVQPRFEKSKLGEVTHEDVRKMADDIVARGAPATAVHAREIVLLVYRFAILKGQGVENPAEAVSPASIATFVPRDRALTPQEIRLFYRYLDRIGTSPSIRTAAKLLLLTMLRKSEMTNGEWGEVNFAERVWVIPGTRMKAGRPHIVFLSNQVLDILVALKTMAGGSRFILPSRYDIDSPMSSATLNQVLTLAYRLAQKEGQSLGKFSPHDLRRTASTLLHEEGYNSDWIEKCLAHEQKGVRAVYNKAEYREQRTTMLQDWADMVDRWVAQED